MTVRNVTGGQPLTPPIAVVHEPGVSLLPTDAADLDGLEELAEAGEQTVLAASLGQMSGVKQVVSFEPPPIRPRRQSAVSISASPGDHVSVIAMLACTNDAITFGTLVIHEDGAPSFSSGRVLDAGTENNDETAATVPCLDGEGVSGAGAADGEGMIASHPGITGNADLDQDTRGWDGQAMQLVLTPAGSRIPQTLEFGLTHRKPDGRPAHYAAGRRGARPECRRVRLYQPDGVGRDRRPCGRRRAGRPAGNLVRHTWRGACIRSGQWRSDSARWLPHRKCSRGDRGSQRNGCRNVRLHQRRLHQGLTYPDGPRRQAVHSGAFNSPGIRFRV